MEGTVICASRAEGLVARAGSAVKVAASGRGGMARGSAGTDLPGAFAAAVLALVTPLFAGGCFASLAFGADAATLLPLGAVKKSLRRTALRFIG